MNILVTGGAGYLGSVLSHMLVKRGHLVTILDAGYFGVGHIEATCKTASVIQIELNRFLTEYLISGSVLENIECIVHLAALSNDASAEVDVPLTDRVNYRQTVWLAEEAKRRSIRFVFSSSCSVYGQADDEVDEEGSLDPLTPYAGSKLKSEQAICRMADYAWRPVIVRNGTLFGSSPRMRFDLVINGFSLSSLRNGCIDVYGSGEQWRPFVHVKDCANALAHFAENGSKDHVIYNVASVNAQVNDLVKIFRGVFPGLDVRYLSRHNEDRRNYKVCSGRLRTLGLEMNTSIEVGVLEIVSDIESGDIVDAGRPQHYNASWMKFIGAL